MPDIVTVVHDLQVSNCPVIFLDTCILLDIIRSVKRRLKSWSTTAVVLHQGITTPPLRYRLVVSHLVQHEWLSNEKGLLKEALNHFTELQEQSNCIHDTCKALGIIPGFTAATYSSLGIVEQLHALSGRLLDAGMLIEQDTECTMRAMHRVIHNIPPSKKGGEAKDCTILEEYLAVARLLRAGGFDKKLVFCTSNTNDYCDAKKLAESLAIEFAALQLDFTTNLPHAFYELTN